MNDDIHALIGAYALDAVTESERARFEEHLVMCPDCRDELAGFHEAGAALSASVAVVPRPAVRSAVLAGISTVRQLPPIVAQDAPVRELPVRRLRRSGRRWLAAAAAAAVLIVGGITWHPWTGGNEPAPVSATQQVLHAPDAHRYVRHVDGATATVVFSPSLGRSVIETRDLQSAPVGHTYQLWYMTPSGKATSAGFVKPSGSGHSVTLLQGHAKSTALVGVTVEPVGGSPRPTSNPILTVDLATT